MEGVLAPFSGPTHFRIPYQKMKLLLRVHPHSKNPYAERHSRTELQQKCGNSADGLDTNLPILLYALEVCNLDKRILQSLDFTVNRFFMKLFRTSNIETVAMETFKSFPLAEVRQIINHKIDLQFTE